MSFTTSGTSPIVVSTKDSSTSTVHVSTKETSTSPQRLETAVASTSMEHVSLIDRGTTVQDALVEKEDSAVNTAQNVMVDAAVNTPPILSWQTPPPPLTFYPKPRPLTSQTPQDQQTALSMQTSKAVSVENKERTVNTAQNVMVNATVNTPPILSWQTPPPPLTFYPKPRPLTSQTPQGLQPALSLPTSKPVSVEKKERTENIAKNVMVDATVNTPPILSWQTPPPPPTFYPNPRPLTSPTSQGQLLGLSQQTTQAVSLEEKYSALKTAKDAVVNATVNTPPPRTFYPQTLPLTSQNSPGELPALANQTSKEQPRALSRQTSEEILPTLSKQALQELLPIFKKQYLQSEPTGLVNPTPRRPTMKSQGIIQTTMNFALLLLTLLCLGCLYVSLQYSLLLIILQRCI